MYSSGAGIRSRLLSPFGSHSGLSISFCVLRTPEILSSVKFSSCVSFFYLVVRLPVCMGPKTANVRAGREATGAVLTVDSVGFVADSVSISAVGSADDFGALLGVGGLREAVQWDG